MLQRCAHTPSTIADRVGTASESAGLRDACDIKALQIVDAISDLLVRLDTEGKIVKRSKKVYTMMLFGMLNFSHTWYDPKGSIEPKEFADMVVDLFLYGFTPPVAKGAAARRQHA